MELNTARALSMLALGLGSFVIGMMPAWFSPRVRQSNPLLLSTLLCFGGGVLLATALLHMLPEARENLPDYSELALCGGFFIVYFADEVVHFFYGKELDREVPRTQYRSNERTTLLGSQRRDEELDRVSPCCGDTENPRMCHVSHKEPCNKSATGRLGLLFALLLHSVFEGVAIGLQKDAAKVLLLLGAVASHKLVVSLCLGVELAESCAGRACTHVLSVLVFSLGSVLGIGAAVALEGGSLVQQSLAIPVLQAIAAGTLLYVTVSEVLPRERARWHEKASRAAGLAQFMAVVAGFAAMYGLMLLDNDEHSATIFNTTTTTTEGLESTTFGG